MPTYAEYLRANNLTSTKQNAARWKNVMRGNPPFSLAAQISRDPLSVPYGGDLIWQGGARPNLATLGQRGYGQLTPVRRPDGGWAVFGVNSDPMPDWAQSQLDDITKRGQQAQADAQNRVMPWLANQLGALNNVQTQAQTNFANLVGQSNADIAGAAQHAGPGGNYAGSAAMAPFQAHEGLANQLAAGQAAGNTAGSAYQAAVDQLQGSNLAQGLQTSLAQEVAQIPDQYEQQRQQFMQQLTPVLLQLQQNQQQGEAARRQAIESRNESNQQLRIEQQIAGVKAQVDLAGLQQKQDAATTKANDAAVHDQFRTLSQIHSGLDQGQTLLDNHGQGFAAKGPAKYHGLPVQWERATDGAWYGTVGKPGGAGSGANAPESVYTNSNTRERLARDLTTRWNGQAPAGSNPGSPGWKDMHEPGVADAAARQVALWVNGNKQFLLRNGKLNDKDLSAFIQSTIPGLDYQRVRYYLNLILARP